MQGSALPGFLSAAHVLILNLSHHDDCPSQATGSVILCPGLSWSNNQWGVAKIAILCLPAGMHCHLAGGHLPPSSPSLKISLPRTRNSYKKTARSWQSLPPPPSSTFVFRGKTKTEQLIIRERYRGQKLLQFLLREKLPGFSQPDSAIHLQKLYFTSQFIGFFLLFL